MQKKAAFSVIAMFASLAGCATAPPLNLNKPTPTAVGGRVTRTISHIACEIIAFEKKYPDLAPRLKNYVAVAQLTLTNEDTGSINPSLSFIKPLAGMGNSRTLGIGGQIGRGRLKSYTQGFFLIFANLNENATCTSEEDPELLTGDLGLEDVILAGMNAIVDGNKAVEWATDKNSASATPYFGSTIKFTTVMGVSGGPSLAKTHFKGFGATNGLLNYSDTGTDLLVIAFASTDTLKPLATAVPKKEVKPASKPKPKPPQEPRVAPPDTGSTTKGPLPPGTPNYSAEITSPIVAIPANPTPTVKTPAPPLPEAPPAPSPASAPTPQDKALGRASQLLQTMILQNINPNP